MTTVKNIYDYINSIAPFDTQEEWDNSGHLIGDFRKEVKTCVMALDATKEVCLFAKSVNADLLLTHHPIIFNGVDSVKADSVVLCVGYTSENTLYNKLQSEVDEMYLLGDARQVSNIMYGIWDAFEVANHI